jgi:hypothetical protein
LKSESFKNHIMQQPLWIIDLFGNSNISDAKVDTDHPASELLHTIERFTNKQFGNNFRWWHYTRITADQVQFSSRGFVEQIIEEGKAYAGSIRTANQTHQQNILDTSGYNVCIIGDIQQPHTRLLFHLLPATIKAKSTLFLPAGFHTGINVKGLLYIPEDILRRNDELSNATTLFLASLETMLKQSGNRSFDDIIYVQDKQCESERENSFPPLNNEQVVALIGQMLINLYFGSKSAIFEMMRREQNDVRQFCTGATAIHYDFDAHLDQLVGDLAKTTLQKFKDDETDPFLNEEQAANLVKSNLDKIKPGFDAVRDALTLNNTSVRVKTERFEPLRKFHPVKNFFNRYLRKKHYGRYLKYLPANLHEYARSFMGRLFINFKEKLAENYQSKSNETKLAIESCARNVFKQESVNVGLRQYEEVIKLVKGKLKEQRDTREFPGAEVKIFQVPRYLQSAYEKFESIDLEEETKRIFSELKTLLENQPVFLGTLARSGLIGLALIFMLIPLLKMLSPGVINLGNVPEYDWLLAIIFLVLPPFLSWFFGIRRQLLRIRRLIYDYIGYLLRKTEYAANEELNKSIEKLYNELITHCEDLLSHSEDIRKNLCCSEAAHSILPVNCFCQPLINGKFGNSQLLANSAKVEYKVYFSDTRIKPISELTDQDYTFIVQKVFSNTGFTEQFFKPKPDFDLLKTILRQEFEFFYRKDNRKPLKYWLNELIRELNLTGALSFAIPAAQVNFGEIKPLISEFKITNDGDGFNFRNIEGLNADSIHSLDIQSDFVLFITRSRALQSVFDLLRPVSFNESVIIDLSSDEKIKKSIYLTMVLADISAEDFYLNYLNDKIGFTIEGNQKDIAEQYKTEFESLKNRL